MATITFRTKMVTVYTMNDKVDYECVNVPVLKSSHCDMNAFRSHKKYGAYANSQLFAGMLARIRKELFPNGVLRLDKVPEGVTVDASGFLVKVTIKV